MSEVERFFENELYTLRLESQEAVRSAAAELRLELEREFSYKLNIGSKALERGIRVHHFEQASYVRLNPFLSSYAQRVSIRGNPNLWILLPDGERLGFRRIGQGNGWRDLKRKWGSKIQFVNKTVVFRHGDGRRYAIYQIQERLERKPIVNVERLAKGVVE